MHLNQHRLTFLVLLFLGQSLVARQRRFLAMGPGAALADSLGTGAQGMHLTHENLRQNEGNSVAGIAGPARAAGAARRNPGRIRLVHRASDLGAALNYSLEFDELQPCASFDCKTGPSLPNFGACGLTTPTLDLFKNASVVFFHIPKVGGSSIENVLMKHAIAARHRLLSFFRPPSPGDLRAISSSATHVTALAKRTAGLEQLTPRPTVTIAAFRHPVTRILSVYNYCRRNVRAPGHAISHQYAFDRWYYKFRGTLSDISNSEVRFLLARYNDQHVYDTAEPSAIFGARELDLLNTTVFKLPAINRRHLDIAKGRVARLSGIAITERLQEGIALLSRVLGVSLDKVNTYMCGDRPCPRLRARREGLGAAVVDLAAAPHPLTDVSLLTPQLRRDMEADNWASMELYKHALGLYRAQMARLGGPTC